MSSLMSTSDPTLDLEFPNWPDMPPPWVPNDEYLAWLRATWSWMKHTPQWDELLKHETDIVEASFTLP